jgi:hypothetical protein
MDFILLDFYELIFKIDLSALLATLTALDRGLSITTLLLSSTNSIELYNSLLLYLYDLPITIYLLSLGFYANLSFGTVSTNILLFFSGIVLGYRRFYSF